MSSLLIENAKGIVIPVHADSNHLRGSHLGDLEILENGYILIEKGIIRKVGPQNQAPDRADEIIDARGRYVLPAWCDSHSHLVYQGSRETEFVDKIKGLSYMEIAAKGGGILNSAMNLRKASEEELLDQALERLEELQRGGTGALEIKSGYGLSLDSELKMLRVAQKLKSLTPVTIKTTFLGAHAIPLEFKNKRDEYIDLVIHRMIPAVADENLADFCDVFCETGFFTPDESRRILEAGLQHGLLAKVHANELDLSGGVQVGVELGAVSVDHLEALGEEELNLLGNSDTCCTLLPGTAFFLNIDYAPARKLIEHNAIVALASDLNPGTCPSGNMSLVLSLACIKMKMTPEESINAATINGAFAMDLNNHGSLKENNIANVIITKKIPSLAYIPYSFGSDLVEKVILKGKIS